jgi:hypothetical protein
MSTSPAKSADQTDQGYFVGFSQRSECGDHEALSAEGRFVETEFIATSGSDSWSPSDQRIIDLVAEHSVDIPATAATTGTSTLQGEAAVRVRHASRLPKVAGLPRVTDEELDLSHGIFLESDTWAGSPVVRRPPHSFSGVKVFLVICAIAGPVAFVLAFASARFNVDLASLWETRTTGGQVLLPMPAQTTSPPAIEPLPVPVTAPAPNEIKLPLEAESPQRAEGQESSTAKEDAATASTALPGDTQSAIAAPQVQALSAPREAEGIVARSEPEPELKTPAMQAIEDWSTAPNAVAAQVAASPSAPAAEETKIDDRTTDNATIDNGAADIKNASMPDADLGGRSLRLSEAQATVWTYCTVNLIPGGQIAVHKAMTYQSCISAGKKCAGPRRYADIQFFDRPTLASKVPIELCDKEN